MAITRVQGNARGTGAVTPLAVTMASNPTSGNVLVAVIGTAGAATRTVSSITQTNVTWAGLKLHFQRIILVKISE